MKVRWRELVYCHSTGQEKYIAVLGATLILYPRPTSTIAVVPKTCGTVLWEAEHTGAEKVAAEKGPALYWNAPMREDNVQMQIEIMNRAMSRGAKGLILAPEEDLPLRTPVYRIVQRGIPVVIVGTNIGLETGKHLSYVPSDERMAGHLAALELGELLHGKGDVALLGINSRLTSMTERADSFETSLAEKYPQIHIVCRSLDVPNVSQEQQAAEAALAKHPTLKAMVTLSEASTRGAYYAISEAGMVNAIHIVGFDEDMLFQVREGGVDALVMQDTNRMGRKQCS